MPDLRVNLRAEFSEFRKAMQGIESDTSRIVGRMDQTFQGLGRSIGTLASGLSVAVIASELREMVNELDEIGKTSQGLGITTEALSGLRYAAEFSNVEISALEAAVAKLNRKLVDAKNESPEALRAFTDIDIDPNQINDVEGALFAIADAFQGMEDGTKKTTAALRIFEESGYKVVNLLNLGSSGLREFRIEADGLGRIVGAEAAADAAKFNDQLERMEQALRGMVQTLVTGDLGRIVDFVERFGVILSATDGDVLGTLATQIRAAAREATGFSDQSRGDLDLLGADFRAATVEVEKLKSAIEFKRDLGQEGLARLLERDLNAATLEMKRTEAAYLSLYRVVISNEVGDFDFVEGAARKAKAKTDDAKEAAKSAVTDADRVIESIKRQILATKDLGAAEAAIQGLKIRGRQVKPEDEATIRSLGNQLDRIKAIKQATQEAADAERDRLANIEAQDTRDALEFARLSAGAETEYEEVIKRITRETRERSDAIRDAIDPQRQFNRLLSEVDALRGQANGLTDDEASTYIAQLERERDALRDVGEEATEADKILERMKGSAAGAFTDAIFEAESFGDALRDLAVEFAKLYTQQQLFKGLNLFSDFLGLGSGGLDRSPAATPTDSDGLLTIPFGGGATPKAAAASAGTVIKNYYIPADVSMSQVEAAFDRSATKTKAEIFEDRERGGVFAS